MVWNKPGNDKQDKLSKKEEDHQRSRQNNGPPLLDEAIKKLMKKIMTLFGKKGSPLLKRYFHPKTFFLLIGVLFCSWIVLGCYVVEPNQKAVVLRWGKYLTTESSGTHWAPYFIDTVRILEMQSMEVATYSAELLTKDQNLVHVEINVSYQKVDPRAYLFNTTNAISSLMQATANAIQHAVLQTTLDDMLSTHHVDLNQQMLVNINKQMEDYQTGLFITDVALQSIAPPEELNDAFGEVTKASEDAANDVNKANSESTELINDAKAEKTRKIAEAKIRAQELVTKAKSEVAEFLALLPEYKAANEVTRERLYLATIEQVMSKSYKIITTNNNTINLPVDKIWTEVSTPQNNETNKEKSVIILPESVVPLKDGTVLGGTRS